GRPRVPYLPPQLHLGLRQPRDRPAADRRVGRAPERGAAASLPPPLPVRAGRRNQKRVRLRSLGFEPSREALRRCWCGVAHALLALRMRRIHTALALNQNWARMGNSFPYFSPVLPSRACLASTGF